MPQETTALVNASVQILNYAMAEYFVFVNSVFIIAYDN